MEDFERCFNFDALYDASYRICRNVRWKDSTINFEVSRIENIIRTEAELRTCEYKQLVFSCFTIIERGKPRNIRACHIDDRLVQNALCEEALLPELTPRFVYDNCATLKGKGMDFALSRVKKHLQAAHKAYGLGQDFYGLRIDIRKYFDSINHAALKETAKKVISDPDIYKFCCYLIDTFAFKPTTDKEPQPGKDYYIADTNQYLRKPGLKSFTPRVQYYECEPRSLGLGSQTSQLFALLSLNEIDHFVKEQLHIKYYGRYMDDIYILHNDKEYLNYCKAQIKDKLTQIGLELNEKKTTITRIQPSKRSIPFKYLKWNFYLTPTNHIVQVPFKSKLTAERRKLRKMQKLWQEGKLQTIELQRHYQAWRAHISKGTCFYITQNMDNYFHSLFNGVEIL